MSNVINSFRRVEPVFTGKAETSFNETKVDKKIIKQKNSVQSTSTESDQKGFLANLPSLSWFLSIPARIWFVLNLLAVPFQILGFILNFIVSAWVVAGIAVVGLWWFHIIPDDQVSLFLGELGTRGLAILNKSGVVR